MCSPANLRFLPCVSSVSKELMRSRTSARCSCTLSLSCEYSWHGILAISFSFWLLSRFLNSAFAFALTPEHFRWCALILLPFSYFFLQPEHLTRTMVSNEVNQSYVWSRYPRRALLRATLVESKLCWSIIAYHVTSVCQRSWVHSPIHILSQTWGMSDDDTKIGVCIEYTSTRWY